MFSSYFGEWEVKDEFEKEFVCIFDGWLGEENLHKLDEVTENEWSKFNTLIRLVSKQYKIQLANTNSRTLVEIDNIENHLSTFEVSMNKDSEQFSKFIIPELECVISEDWDYTYILWYKNKEVV
jgi:hypothetical protein